MSVESRLRRCGRELARAASALRFGAPVTHVYNPLDYAWKPHAEFIRRYGSTPKRVVFLGMNPGPFGMAQTGVPFGEVAHVRAFLGIDAPVGAPEKVHPKRPVDGFACARSEVSGARVWGAIADAFGTAEAFFRDHYVVNYCPLLFVEGSGRNRTPDKLPAAEREPLFEICDRHLARAVAALEPEWVIGIGAFGEARAHAVLGERVKIGRILHPSPASPLANRDWAGTARQELRALGLCSSG